MQQYISHIVGNPCSIVVNEYMYLNKKFEGKNCKYSYSESHQRKKRNEEQQLLGDNESATSSVRGDSFTEAEGYESQSKQSSLSLSLPFSLLISGMKFQGLQSNCYFPLGSGQEDFNLQGHVVALNPWFFYYLLQKNLKENLLYSRTHVLQTILYIQTLEAHC